MMHERRVCMIFLIEGEQQLLSVQGKAERGLNLTGPLEEMAWPAAQDVVMALISAYSGDVFETDTKTVGIMKAHARCLTCQLRSEAERVPWECTRS